MLAILKRIGPGAIVASATIGAGETVLAVRLGAWGGYELLWLILLAVLAKSFLTLYLLGRYAAISGRPVADKLIELPGPRGWFLWLMLGLEGLVAPFVFVVIAVPCGRLMSEIFSPLGWNLSYQWWSVTFLTLALLVGMVQQYQMLERSQAVVCLILLAGTLWATYLVRPDLVSILKGSFSFGHFPPYPEWVPAQIRSRNQLLEMASAFGYAGSIAINYVVYSNWVVVKGWVVPRTATRLSLRTALAPLRWDAGFNAVLVWLSHVGFPGGRCGHPQPAGAHSQRL